MGRVLNLTELTIGVLTQILQDGRHKQYNRAIAIAIANETNSTWTAKGTYLSLSTTSDLVIPEEIPHGKAGIYSSRQVGYMPIIGISGVLTFMLNDGNILALMFSVPYNQINFFATTGGMLECTMTKTLKLIRHSLMSCMLRQVVPSKVKINGAKKELETVILPEDI